MNAKYSLNLLSDRLPRPDGLAMTCVEIAMAEAFLNDVLCVRVVLQ